MRCSANQCPSVRRMPELFFKAVSLEKGIDFHLLPKFATLKIEK